MLNRKVKNIANFILTLGLCLALAMPAWAADNETFKPSEIIGALNGINTVSGEYDTRNDVILAKITKPTSLGIDDIVNIDIGKIHQTYPLTGSQEQMLKEHGYSEEEIAQMDMGDFANLEWTWPVSSDVVSAAKYLYKGLADVDISNWTYGEWQAYYRAEDKETYAPSAEIQQALIDRNITLDDARTLTKDYHTYENLLAQTDEQLADNLRGYYQFTIDNIYNMLLYEKDLDEDMLELYLATYPNPDPEPEPEPEPEPDDNIAVDLPEYEEGQFAGTADEAFRARQAAQAIYICIRLFCLKLLFGCLG